MELKSKNAEACFAWLLIRVEEMPYPPPENHLTWQIETPRLYQAYCKEVPTCGHGVLSVEDFWGCVQLLYPRVLIKGRPGQRIFSGLRLRYLPTQADRDRVEREKRSKALWDKRWAEREAG